MMLLHINLIPGVGVDGDANIPNVGVDLPGLMSTKKLEVNFRNKVFKSNRISWKNIQLLCRQCIFISN